MAKEFKFGHKSQTKSWDEFDKEAEEKKLGWVLIGTVVAMIFMALFMWWIKSALK